MIDGLIVAAEDSNPKNVCLFANSFLLLLIGIAISISLIFLVILLIPAPIEPSSFLPNNSISEPIMGVIAPIPINYNNSIGENTSNSSLTVTGIKNNLIGMGEPLLNTTISFNTTISKMNDISIKKTSALDKINSVFISSNISTISESSSMKGGLLDLIIDHFTIFLTIIGAFSLFCFFYFNITFNANVISEYSESQQKNPIIFFQIAILGLILILFFLISVLIFHLKFQFFELVVLGLLFIIEFFTAIIFGMYSILIRPTYENLVQFAAIRDLFNYKGKDIFDALTGFISILTFIFIFLIVIFGVNSNFNIFSIFFCIILLLIMIWQINIIEHEPRRIFNVKIKDNDHLFQGLILSKLSQSTIQLFVNDNNNKNKIFQFPRSSIEYIVFNRKISKYELKSLPEPLLGTFFSNFMPIFSGLKNFFKMLIGFVSGFLIGLILLVLAGMSLPNTSNVLLIQFVIYSLLVLILGFWMARTYFLNK